MTKVEKEKVDRICQGDILKDINFIEYISEKDGVLEISKVNFPYVVVLTQDCELEQDYRYRNELEDKKIQNKMLLSVLVAPIYNSEHVFLGEHLSDLGITTSPINKSKTEGKLIIKNEIPRYHYLEFPDDVSISSSIVDFKHYFSLNVEELRIHKNDKFVCKISELYREKLSQRFANYLSRIGLPS